MATFDSDLVAKLVNHRGLYQGKEQQVSGSYRVNAGGSLATADLLRMVPLGENQRPLDIRVSIKRISGTPVITNGSFSIGVAPKLATNVSRPDGTVYTPIVASTTVLGASTALGADNQTYVAEPPDPSTALNWGPYYVTLTPSGAGALSVAGGAIDIVLTVMVIGERTTADPIYSQFNAQKYK